MQNSPKPLSRYWLLLGVSALAIAGLFSLVLVIARTPSLSDIPLFTRLFHQALVVHVDLSVLLWFLSIACMLWSLLASGSKQYFPYLEEAALISFALGMLGIALSVLDPNAIPLMSNYIPVLMSPLFFMGLSLTACGVMLMLIRLFTSRWSEQFSLPLRFAIFSAGLIAVIAAMSFYWSHKYMPRNLEGQQYYELAFWGGGHVLQYLHTQILLACWLLLVWKLKPTFTINRYLLKTILCVALATALVVPIAYMLFAIVTARHREFFTQSMILTGATAPAVLSLYIIAALWAVRDERKGGQKALWSSLLMSVILFLYGGFLGSLIQGQNVVIPAHYHGSIVGITLGFMGIAYLYLPKFGYRDASGWRMTFWQPIVYGGGQLLHISGLAWSGGYGVLRKTPGGMDALSTNVKVAMGFMGLGGLIAIIGGFMFVIVIAKAVFAKEKA